MIEDQEVVMRFLNEGQWDRSMRMLVGIVLVVAGWIEGAVPEVMLMAN